MGIFSNFWNAPSSESKTITQPKYTENQLGLLDILAEQAHIGLQAGSEVYPEQMWAGVNPFEKAYMDSSSYTTGGNVAREAAVRSAISGNPAYQVDDDTTQAYWNKYIAPQVEKQRRQLIESYAPGIFSGGKDIALGEFETGVLGQFANLQYMDEQARRQALTDAFNRQANTAVSAYTSGLTNDQNIAALARSIEEKKLATDYQRWMSGEPNATTGTVNQAANPYRTLALSLLNISPYTYQQQVDTAGGGLGYGALTGALNGLGGAAVSALPAAWSALSNWYNNLGSDDVGDVGELIDYQSLINEDLYPELYI